MEHAHDDGRPAGTRMPQPRAGAPVTLRYWAGARSATGVDSDALHGCATVADALAEATRLHPGLAPVAAVSSLLLDGRPAGGDTALPPGSVLEVLPPFAGG
ncbi:MAG TPA: MoaD/ThiS family protein [Pedococcus sp.]|uniref:MoaD/ThiS family protein n=1 Tax=Pedococcus sp. TaxID=2860345 RepID=UPI002F93E870